MKEGRGSLLNIGRELFRKGQAPGTIGFQKKVQNCTRGVLHHKVRAAIGQLAKVIDWQDIRMLQVGDPLSFIKKAVASFLRKLFDTQNFQGQDATERRGFAYFIDMAKAA